LRVLLEECKRASTVDGVVDEVGAEQLVVVARAYADREPQRPAHERGGRRREEEHDARAE